MPINSFLYPGAKVVSPFTVANSLRFDGSSSNLSRTKGTSDSTKIGTYSWWIKNSKFIGQNLIDCGDAFADSSSIYISSNNTLTVFSRISNSNVLVLETDREFRDPSAWHNIVVAIDTTQGTASNRVKVYVDGVQQTSFSTETYPDQNADLRFFTSSETEKISSTTYESGGFFGGYMCEVVKVDGQQLAPTSFGEFDSDTPTVWKPIDVAGLTFGTNGYYLDFEDSSTLGNNVSGGSDFSTSGLAATDQSTDTCTNNFATLNPLGSVQQGTLSEGNLKVTSSSAYKIAPSTIAVSSGKWYVEHKITGSSPDVMVGIISVDDYEANPGNINYAGDHANSVGYYKNGKRWIANGAANYGATFTTDDIIGIALDLDSGTKTIIFYKNGSSQGSLNLPSNDDLDYYFLPSPYNGTIEMNFGSPFYSISSGNSDANGHGNFEYAVPSGYYALNTKNLAEFG